MSLPDISRIVSAPPGRLRAFGKRLADIGLELAAATEATARSRELPRELRGPIRSFHLRQRRSPLAYALRMLLFSDPVSTEDARACFGPLLDELFELGILVRADDGSVVSPFVLALFDDLYLLADDLRLGADAVMGIGETTVELCRAALPRRRLRRVLDLGCGAGTVACVMARVAEHVVATDINPRALALARANAAINGIGNLELREGSLFEPVAGETFDLVVSQPPFVSRPQGAADASFLYGGSRGDELAREILARVVAHLTRPGGRAVLYVVWPQIEADPLLPRIRDAVGRLDAHVVVLQAPPVSADLHSASYAAGLHPRLDDAFEAAAISWSAHFAALGIEAVLPTITVLERTDGTPGVGELIATRPLAAIAVTASRVDRILAARALGDDDERLLACTLRVPDETVFAQEQLGPGAEVPSTISARFGPRALVPPIEMTPEMLFAITAVHEAPDVRAAIARLAETTGWSPEEALRVALPAVRSALRYGLLELRDA